MCCNPSWCKKASKCLHQQPGQQPVKHVPEANCGNIQESLRELAKEGAALHRLGQPEREICDGLLAALDENNRLRSALWHVQYTAKTLADAQVIALESKRPNV